MGSSINYHANGMLIIGLGNPGAEYKNTRHNAGFMMIDYLVNHYKLSYDQKKKLQITIAQGNYPDIMPTDEKPVDNAPLFFAKPLTYMNLSGQAVRSLVSYYKISLNNIIIIHDDIDLPLGKVKIKLGGSSGGHNGLKSIDSALGPNYYRLRLGIGRPEYGDVADYVLKPFSLAEHELLMQLIAQITVDISLLFLHKIEDFKRKISYT